MNLEDTVETARETDQAVEPEQPEHDPRDEEVVRLRAQVAELEQRALRTLAEAQTVQRRIRAQAEVEMKMAVQPLVERLLPVLDNLERAQEALAAGATAESVAAGLLGLEKQLLAALEASGVQRIASVGESFDPSVHEAIAVVGHEDGEERVAEEVSAGYRLHDRVVRAAKVKVARGG